MPQDKTAPRTGAQVLIQQLAARGARRIFGVPGGDCSLDIIAAAREAGLEFILTRTENAAAMMAATSAEVTGTLGVLMTTRGPGLANGANGVACAALDRAPLAVISDGYENEQAFVSHQRFDQAGMLAPVTKGSLRVDSPQSLAAIGALLDRTMEAPAGPVYLEVTGKGMRCEVPSSFAQVQVRPPVRPAPDAAAVAQARELMARARRPVMIVGLQANRADTSNALRALVQAWGCPVYTTYKSRGALDDADPVVAGPFQAGAAEDGTLQSADLIVMFGADPIEFLPKPWGYPAPVVELTEHPFARNFFVPAVSVIGDLAQAATQLREGLARSPWSASDLAGLQRHMRDRAMVESEGGPVTPNQVARALVKLMPEDARITVDAGAHMLSVMALFRARRPHDVFISRGLATMAYALPAAIGAALAQPQRPVVAITGDGGLMMCAAELATAVQAGCKLTVVVYNDANLSLIDVKQRQRGLAKDGMEFSRTDFSLVARGFGCEAFRVDDPAQLEDTLRRALQSAGPSLVDVAVDSAPYHAQVKSLRG